MKLSRNTSSLIFFLIFALCVLWDLLTKIHLFPTLVIVTAIAATLEAVALMKMATGGKPWRLGSIAMVVALVFDGWHGGFSHIDIIIVITMLGFLLQGLTQPIGKSLVGVSGWLLAALWVGLGFGSILTLWSWNGPESISREGRYLVVFLLPAAMFQDVFAMWVGCAIGKHKLAPKLSPNKSVEGSIAGLLGSMLVAMIVFAIYERFTDSSRVLPLCDFFTWWDALVLGALFGSVGQLGDLSESLLKREAGVKDSGDTATGHGGVLDVFDSLLFCAPAMILWAWARGLWMFG